jgi:SAM-dependent methyltransferase
MDDLQLLMGLHKGGRRQGPGGEAETRLAIALAGLSAAKDLRIADIGCGTGASTLVLAQHLDAHVTAVDFIPEFLARLEAEALRAGVAGRIETRAASMDALPFAAAALDAIWSEGAIYNIGFANGVAAWRRYLKPSGVLAVSEITWLTRQRPRELADHWQREYAEIDTASAKIAILEQHGFSPLGYSCCPSSAGSRIALARWSGGSPGFRRPMAAPRRRGRSSKPSDTRGSCKIPDGSCLVVVRCSVI